MIIKIHFSNENSGSDKLSDFARFIRRAKVRPNFAYEVADKPYDDAGVTDQGKLGRCYIISKHELFELKLMHLKRGGGAEEQSVARTIEYILKSLVNIRSMCKSVKVKAL